MSSIVLGSAAKTVVNLDGKAATYFGGTNYFGMSYNQEVILAAQEGLIKWGMNSAGSRQTTGSAAAHLELEQKLAEALQRPNVVTCCSGYMINLILLQALQGMFDICLLDEGAHCSVRDAVNGSAMPMATFRSCDVDDLGSKLQEHHSLGQKALICTDGVFASGALAPICAYQELARKWEAAILMDDAHGVGVLGKHGRGTLEHLGLPPDCVYQTGTLSKAFGCFGGFVAGDKPLTELVREHSDAYIGSTPLPPAIACAAMVSIDIVSSDTTLRASLRRNTELLKSGLRSLGIEFEDGPTPISVFVLGDKEYNLKIHKELLDSDQLVPYNFYPGGPEHGFFRMVVTAMHTQEQISRVIKTLGRLTSRS